MRACARCWIISSRAAGEVAQAESTNPQNTSRHDTARLLRAARFGLTEGGFLLLLKLMMLILHILTR